MTKSPDDVPDLFATNKVFPDAGGVFYSGYKPLEIVTGDGIVVLDTNALLVPYTVGKRGLKDVASTYRKLLANDRLVVPGHVAREFARNRPLKIGDLVQAIGRKRELKTVQHGRYPLLEGIPSYEVLVEVEQKLDSLVNEYRRAIDQVLEDVKGWTWNDPVSALYSEIFPKAVEDPELDPQKMTERLRYGIANKIPPGYKDAAKDDGGIGDLLIWETILRVAASRN